jgi:hypothetical protein
MNPTSWGVDDNPAWTCAFQGGLKYQFKRLCFT